MKELKKQRVLFFISSLGAGGAERVCTTLLEHFSKKYDCDMIVVSGNNSAFEISEATNILFLDNRNKNKNGLDKLFTIIRNRKKINKFINENEKKGPYVLITAHLNMGQVAALLSCKREKTMYVMHNPQNHNKGYDTWMYKLVFKQMFKDKLLGVVSEGVKKELVCKYKIEEENITTIYNPIDIEKINILKEKPIEYGRKYILAIGRLNHEKRFDRLIEAYALGKFYEHYDLVILGEGELRQQLETKIKNMKLLKYVQLKGYCDNPFAWMKNACLVVNTSDYEALPMCIIEALASGAKVVAAKCNYGPDELLINEYYEYLVEPIDDLNEYISKMKIAIEYYPMLPKGYVERFAVDNIAEDYLKKYTYGMRNK